VCDHLSTSSFLMRRGLDSPARPGLLRTAAELSRVHRSASRPSAVQELQLARLRWMVDHASRHVPLYRRLYPADAGHRLRQLDDLSRLPFTDKDMYQATAAVELMSGRPPPGSRRIESSGSTGQPVEVYYSPRAAWYQGVLKLQRERAIGLRPWERRFSISEPDERSRRGIESWIKRRALRIPGTESPAVLARSVLEWRPVSISGHGQQLLELGEELGGAFRPRLLAAHGESLDLWTRRALASAFAREPLDGYGTSEQGIVAWQCGAVDLYHVNHEAVVVEVLDDGGRPVSPGGTGELVLTGLWNPLMPILRYRIGDIGTLADRPCACGYRLPALRAITGRTMDWVVDGNGRRVAPQRLWIEMDPRDWAAVLRVVRRYQVHQEHDGTVLVDIVARGRLPEAFVDTVLARYRGVLGQQAVVKVRQVGEIPLDPSGKFRLISSALGRRDVATGAGPTRS